MLRNIAVKTRIRHLSSKAYFASSLAINKRSRASHGHSNYRFTPKNLMVNCIIPLSLDDESKDSHEINPIQFQFETKREVKEKPIEKKYLPKSGLLSRHIGQRIAWGLALFGSAIIFAFGGSKAFLQCLTLNFRKGLNTLKDCLYAGYALAFCSLAGIIHPSLVLYFKRDLILPASPSYDLPSGLPCFNVIYSNGTVKSKDFLTSDKTSDQYIIYFCGNSYRFQDQVQEIERIITECNAHVRTMNYPSDATSSVDLINAGIAQIYQLTEKHNWSNQDIEQKVFIYGRGLGGAISLKIGEFFKEKQDIDISLFVDRSFESLKSVAVNYANQKGIPKWLGELIAPCVLYASGGWDIDCVAAANKLKRDNLHYINLGHTRFLNQDADPIIPDGTTFTDGFNRKSMGDTKNILASLRIQGSNHIVYPPFHGDFHNAPLEQLKAFSGAPANELLRDAVVAQQRRNRPSPSA